MQDIEEFEAESHPEATPNAIAMVHIVNASGPEGWKAGDALAEEMRKHGRLADATVVAVLLPNLLEIQESMEPGRHIDRVVHSFEEAAQCTVEKFMK
jgi:hypothetical protein